MRKTIYSRQSQRLCRTLVELRRRAGFNQRQLARKLGRERSLVGRLELGERRVDVVEFFWICRACGADPVKRAARLMRQFARLATENPKPR